MAATSTDSLIAQAVCLDCIPYGYRLPVLISLFAKIADVPTDTNSLIAGAECISQCIPAGLQLAVLISLADQIAQGGGTVGASCLGRSVGPPVWVPDAGCDTAISFDDTGGMWWYATDVPGWIKFG